MEENFRPTVPILLFHFVVFSSANANRIVTQVESGKLFEDVDVNMGSCMISTLYMIYDYIDQ